MEVLQHDSTSPPGFDPVFPSPTAAPELRSWPPPGDALRAPRELDGTAARLLEQTLALVGPIRIQRSFVRIVFRASGLVEHTLSLPMGKVHVWVSEPLRGAPEDTRPPLLLLHGFGADAEQQWVGQVWQLSRHHRLIVPDLLYFGGSWPLRRSVSLDDQIAMVLELMDYLRVERCDVLGISFGGLVAFELASRYGRRVRKVVISNSPGHVLEHEDHHAMLSRFDITELADLLVPSHPRKVQALLGIAYHRPPSVPGVALRDAFRHFFRSHAEERRGMMRSLTARIAAPELANRKVPHDTLVLWGEHDRVFPVNIGRRLSNAIGHHARLHVIPGTAHAPNQEKAREYNRIVLSFLKERRHRNPSRALPNERSAPAAAFRPRREG